MTSKKRLTSVGLPVVSILILVALLLSWFAASDTGSSRPDGRRGGHVIALRGAEGVQAEFTVDSGAGRMVIYLQKSGTRDPYAVDADRLDAKFSGHGDVYEATFDADPTSEDPSGRSSRFSFDAKQLPQQLLLSNDFVLSLSVSIDGDLVKGKMSHLNDHSHTFDHD